MGLLGRLMESRAFTPHPEGWWGSGVPGPGTVTSPLADSGELIGEQQALRLTAVHACVRLLSDSIASLPLDAYRKRGGGFRQEVTPTPPLIADPFPEITDFSWKFMVVSSLVLRGNAYCLVTSRDEMERPVSLMPLHPDVVMLRHDEQTGAVTYHVGGDRVPASDMFHVPAFLLPGYREGLSPIGAAKQGIGLGLAAERFGSRWFGDGAAPSSILSTEQELTPDQRERNMKAWVSTHGGRRYPAMLEGGMSWRPVTIMPNESQFLETRRFQVSEIARLFGVPPHMIGDVDRSTSWGSGIEQQSIGFVTYTLRPWLTRIEAALTRLLPRGQFVRFNVDGLLRGDTKARYEAYTQARTAGWLNVNEIRELEDREPVEDGDQYIQPLNMGPLGSDPLAEAGGESQEGDDDE